MRIGGMGGLLTVLLTPGQRGDRRGFAQVVNGLQVRRGQQGRPRSRPRKIVADEAYLSVA